MDQSGGAPGLPSQPELCHPWAQHRGKPRVEACGGAGAQAGAGDQWKKSPQGADTHREPGHAELCFLDRVRSWHLDEGRQYRLTCYISWTPGPDCAQKLVEFLGENRHVSLRIFAAGIHTKYRGHEDGLRQLWDAGAQIAIMTLNELQHCWETFVDNQGQPFEPWPIQVEHIQTESQKLKDILRSGVFW
ncbi:DNA dC-_dU-editing enzyme APOBEC-3G-like isoform X4 [Myotis lucifugus]|uniref:DNA dC->dU-editing enzyme APOBEC-3G-like isoform X4 n=1 Tax=Myotis lucifugus TaxID=59463 RepID=UPI000CCC8689|nr:DNA dC->dU-editing enzyme APOBEC-3G-like isoform X4 [Myotis lucifugus]XP_023603386.1 DNA dC->dU-editing enzyme APOBEC-3G-like isoform X4 [Myotis lucifugus]